MKKVALLLMLATTAAVAAAPAPLPKPPPNLVPESDFWQIDFSPLAKAGTAKFNLMIYLQTTRDDGGVSRTRFVTLKYQEGTMVSVPTVIANTRDRIERSQVVCNRRHPSCELRSLEGRPVGFVRVTAEGLDKKFLPVVKPPREKKGDGGRTK